MVSVEMIGMTLGTLLCPVLMKRHGGRSLCLFVGALCVALSIATAFATTNTVLLIVRLAAGTCAGWCMPMRCPRWAACPTRTVRSG